MKKILLTGFDPFSNEPINPSFEIIKSLDVSKIDADVMTLEVPTVFYESSKLIIETIHMFKPDIVIMLGQAGGRKEISIERVALNINHASIPDNRGIMPINQNISLFGPAAYFSTLPLDKLLNTLKNHHIPVEISNSAGTYVCNHVMYSVLHETAQNALNLMAGFIHVPYLPEQTIDKPSKFSLDKTLLVKALEYILISLLED